ncbi:unnamed protein product [Linum tenue]|uniref:Uncharacterized protein n=2 Tax=Linum tenue TaxID=586396 RepID=A0AAV0QLL9_9ROSI|nr:unnamed protein product [Linum tenue]
MIGLHSKNNKERRVRDHDGKAAMQPQELIETVQLSKRVAGHSKKVSTFSEPLPRKTTQFNAPRDSFSQHKRVTSSGQQSLQHKKEIIEQVRKRNTPSSADMEEDENPDSGEYSLYESSDEDLVGEEVENESGREADNPTVHNNVVNVVQKRTRGPTSCMEIHAVEMDERHTITVNEFGQPIGDDKKFSSFLGTVARNNKFAPLNYISWKDVPMEKKEDIWNYVNVWCCFGSI